MSKEAPGTNKLLYILLMSVTVSQLMYLTFPTFAPMYAKENSRHADMTPFLFSIVTSMYQLSRLLFSTTIGATLQKVGKKNYIMIGFGILITCCLGFASLSFIPDEGSDIPFFFGSLILNFIQGIGGTALQIAGQAIVLLQFGAKREVGLAYLSAARGLGFLGGPALGQIFYGAAGFAGAFLIFAGILSGTVIISFIKLPKTLNIDNTKTAQSKQSDKKLAEA